jgi:hypothetical protein
MRLVKTWLLPIVLGALIDGVSEVLKFVGGNFPKQVSDGKLMERMPWDNLLLLLFVATVMTVVLYFLMSTFVKFESHNLSIKIAILVVTLVFLGSTNLWEVLLERGAMRASYDEISTETTFTQVKNKFNRSGSLSYQGEYSLSVPDAFAYSLRYEVPKAFGETTMMFYFGKDWKVVKKTWRD